MRVAPRFEQTCRHFGVDSGRRVHWPPPRVANEISPHACHQHTGNLNGVLLLFVRHITLTQDRSESCSVA